MPLDHATAADLLEAYGRAWETFDGDAFVDLFTEDVVFDNETAGEHLVGHNALRADLLELMRAQEQVEFTVERLWVVDPTVLAVWHLSYVGRASHERVRLSGFLVLEVAPDGRIEHLREWWARRSGDGPERGAV